jgi:hypothetical protein
MYLRFTTTAIDEDSHKSRGLFTEAYALLDNNNLNSDEWKTLRGLLDWFNANLPHPPKKFNKGRAIFWFRSDASECIDKIWEMVNLLRLHDRHIIVHKCRHLRNIAYSDKLQVAAYPSELDDRIIEH